MAGRGKLKLTTKALEQLSKAPPTGDVFDTELTGFHVRPTKRGLTFRLYYRTKAGNQRQMTIGRYGTLTVAQARKFAAEALASVTQGGDPQAEREEAKAEAKRQQQTRTTAPALGASTNNFKHQSGAPEPWGQFTMAACLSRKALA